MPIETRNITGIDSDAYDNRAPDRPHYNSTPYRASKFAMPPLWIIVVLVLAAMPLIAVFAWALARVFYWIGEINYFASEYDAPLLISIKFVVTIALSIVFVGIALLTLAFVASRMIVRLQNNMPVSVLDIIFGGAYARELSRTSLTEYYAERRALWENSGLWALETLDLSRTDAPKFNSGAPGIIDAVADVPLLPSGDGAEPMAATLVRAGMIGRSGNSILAGFSASDKPHYMELDETGLIAVAGLPRVGKSATAAFIAAQAAMIPGAQIFVCDKHSTRHDSITRRIEPLAPVIAAHASTIDEISALIDRWFEIGRDRLLKSTNDKFPPVFVIIDEFTAMIILEELPEPQLKRLLSGSVEFPKIQAHGLYIAHQFTGRLLGGTLGAPLRRVTTQRIVHRIDPQDAEFLLPDRKLARTMGQIGSGRAVFFGASQTTPVEIAVPYMTHADLEYIARVLPPASTSAPTRPVAANVSRVSDVSSALQSAATRETINMNAARVNGDETTFTVDSEMLDKYAINQARHFLSRRKAGGDWAYSIRDVQAMTNLRTGTIVQIAHSIGRKRGAE